MKNQYHFRLSFLTPLLQPILFYADFNSQPDRLPGCELNPFLSWQCYRFCSKANLNRCHVIAGALSEIKYAANVLIGKINSA